MKRARANRRKSAQRPIRLPIRLPRLRIDLRWLVLPPAAIAALVMLFLGVQAALRLPIDRLQIEGVFERVAPLQVEAAVAGVLDRGFLTADLGRVRRAVEALDWIDSAEVTRVWPDTLAIEVVEQQVAARWGDAGLLNVRGDLFSNDRRYSLPELPVLSGPPGSEHDVAKRYLELRDRLAAAGLSLRGIAMDDRGAWSIDLEGGQQIRLGKQNVETRLERLFALVLPALAGELNRVSYVDMRYTNGFAVAWLGALELSNASDVLGSG
ncbi:MAG TPA: cell division protein FtsQ/DivIB [Gammaproteobacteria bacterium]|nr:cell division protein FtsQ/DivIB [Gammaproteobacteria bacterium]